MKPTDWETLQSDGPGWHQNSWQVLVTNAGTIWLQPPLPDIDDDQDSKDEE